MKKNIIGFVLLAMLPFSVASIDQSRLRKTVVDPLRNYSYGTSFAAKKAFLESVVLSKEFKDQFLISLLRELQARALEQKRELELLFMSDELSSIIDLESIKKEFKPFVFEGQEWALGQLLIQALVRELQALKQEEEALIADWQELELYQEIKRLADLFVDTYSDDAVYVREMAEDEFGRSRVLINNSLNVNNLLNVIETPQFKRYVANLPKDAQDRIAQYLVYLGTR